MYTKQVTVSGSVGKQVYAANMSAKIILRGWILSPISATANVVIRHGNASGDIIVQHSSLANAVEPVILPGQGIPMYRGTHVKVIGAGAACYLLID